MRQEACLTEANFSTAEILQFLRQLSGDGLELPMILTEGLPEQLAAGRSLAGQLKS